MRGRSTIWRAGLKRQASGTALALSLALATTSAIAQAPPQSTQQQPRPQPAPQQPRPAQSAPRPVQPPVQQQRQAQQPGTVDQLISGVGPVCMRAPARQCVDLGFAYADRNRDQRLSLPETRAVHDEVNAWARDNAPKLPPVERQRLVTGLLVIQTVGPDALFESYDTNRDGALTKEEALADIRLDQRPLPQVLSDPNAVDWRRLTDRAGMAAPLLKRLFPM